MGESWDVNNFKQGLVADKGQNYKPTFGAMRQLSTNERGVIADVKVVDAEKRRSKEHSGSKSYAGLRQLFQEKQHITIPELPVARFAGGMLFGALAKKQCKHIEEFCQRVIQLPPVVSQSDIVQQFFSQWGTDAFVRIESNEKSTKLPNSPFGRGDDELVERYQSVAEFTGGGRGEMSLRENEVVTVIEKNSTGWWLVANSRGEHGFAPATFLEPVDSRQRTEEEEWRDVEEDERFWVAIESYSAKSDDELTYRAGEEVEVLATSNFGWWKIKIKGKVGLTPGSNLAPKPSADPLLPDNQQKKRGSSYSSISGIYASIRSPPPRRSPDQHKSSVRDMVFAEDALEYATVEILSSSPLANRSRQFSLEDSSETVPQYASVIPKHLRLNRSHSMNEDGSEIRRPQKRNGCPDLPPTPPLVSLHNSHSRSVDHDDMSYARVHEFRQPLLTSTPRVRLLQPPDEGLVRFGSHKYENVLRADVHAGIPGKHYVAITNYSPPSDRTEDLHLTANEEVRLLCEDGAWSFVCTVDATKRSGWVPSSLLKSMGGSQCNMTRRSLSVGDIYNAYEEEEAAARGAPLSQMAQKRPVPTPRGDLEQKKNSVDITGAPSEEAPPLPGAPPDYIRKSDYQVLLRKDCFLPGKVNEHYFAREDFTTKNSNCISVRKGEVGQLLAVQSLGWWKMNVEGVVGWTPGDFWELLQDEEETLNEMSSKSKQRERHSSFGDELWYYGKMSRQKCEELMIRNAKELDYLIRESTQKFASFVLSVKYGGKIRHFPIELTPSGRYVIGKHAFDGLTEIVTFYKTHALFYTQNKEAITLGESFRGM
ncbi:SH3 and PX domain-containing protein 2B [Stylophora pistillata]|uniref:SH3 and PX domain-containing protein 2B n=1 Tax=Stylophora pistillata TaxID=50429 RepID=A0A2B4ST04_STYPI|nr:SH3 and PX domain-containing protein 2B [Stylophora pistillata]